MSKYSFDAVIFDLDGVVTQTARIHARAWKTTFDQYLQSTEERDKRPFREFTHDKDYLEFVDGKPRYEGVKSFLESRQINIEYGDPSDSFDQETVCGLGNKKNALFNQILEKEGSEIYTSTVELIKSLRSSGVRIGVASSSKNCQTILKSSGIEELFETRVDGVVSVELGLKGKPEGDIFVRAAANLGAVPARSIMVEDATSGVQAGRNGGFGLVLGVARKNNQKQLLENGADVVVSDIAEINTEQLEAWFHRKPRSLLDAWDTSSDENMGQVLLNPLYKLNSGEALLSKKKIIFFLDYDGTLTPIVDRPDLAIMSRQMRDIVSRLLKKHTVAIVSGRMREDVEKLVGIKDLFYAGSHGFDIVGPGFTMVEPKAQETIPVVSEVIAQLKKDLGSIKGVLIEEKKFSTAVHYRLVDQQYFDQIQDYVNQIIKKYPSLRLLSGKKVFEILPNIDWDKGKAIRWIMQALNLSWSEYNVIYIGDDTTDEYAFRAIRTRGMGILVADQPKASAAHFQLYSVEQVGDLFEKIITLT